MKKTLVMFASLRYWEEGLLDATYEILKNQMADGYDTCHLVRTQADLDALPCSQGELLIAFPLSGAVQPLMKQAAQRFGGTLVYAGYVAGNFQQDICDYMLKYNAAPTVMDTWAVLRREGTKVLLAYTKAQFADSVQAFEAYFHVQSAKVILIGDMEPWVISASRDLSVYKRLGITVEQVPQQELRDVYEGLEDPAGEVFYQHFIPNATYVTEPTDGDVKNACRMAAAVVQLAKEHQANGVAIACFNLLGTGTTMCLGVSYLNDDSDIVAACEGDVDSVCTMLLLKKLTQTKLWMANPSIQPDGTINFTHCTAPLGLSPNCPCAYGLRSHHESGIGVSVQTEYPVGTSVTACRISNEATELTVQTGISCAGRYEPSCRTQMHVAFADKKRYLDTALGCHQVFAFEDIAHKVTLTAQLLGLQLL